MTMKTEKTEAVIVSGPRRGELVTLDNGEAVFTAADEALLASIVDGLERLVEGMRAARLEADGLAADVRQLRERSGESSRTA